MLKAKVTLWIESYFYSPSFLQKILSKVLLPLSYLYCFVVYIKYKLSKEIDFGIDIVSIGNLSVGGSGKTPLGIALASRYKNAAIILRGYNRQSKGLYIVDQNTPLSISGDEALVYATKLKNATIIVSEDRIKAIAKAKELGCDIIFLDDAYSKHYIKKLDLLILTKDSQCLPSGPLRERLWSGKKVITIEDTKDFKRVVSFKNKSDKMSLVTAIAKPQRLDKYLPDVISKNYFEDHHNFSKDEAEFILKRDNASSLLVTLKDYVKLKHFNIPLSLIDLDIEVDERIYKAIDNYRRKNRAKKD